MRRRALVVAAASGALVLSPLAAWADDAGAAGAGAAVPATKGYVLRVLGAERPTAGVVRLRFELSARGDSATTLAGLRGAAPWSRVPVGYDGLRIAASGTGAVGRPVMNDGACSCTKISAPPPGKAVQGTVDLADPGGERIDVFPLSAQPVLAVPVSGTPAPAQQLDDVALRSVQAITRTRTAAATVNHGTKVRVDLDTSVLFALDSAALSPKAKATLDAAATVLKQQSGRRIGVYGHTDSQGSDAHNLVLSRQRAQAVRAALAQRLGSGWTFVVKGYGETKPLVPERGPAEAVKEAQAKNRRVELQVL